MYFICEYKCTCFVSIVMIELHQHYQSRVTMKTEVKQSTLDKLKLISAKRKELGKSDWSSEHILEPVINKLYSKECK